MFDIIIKNGWIVDGSGRPGFAGDVAIRNGRIARIAPAINGEAARIIDAAGMTVAPGFIDCHSHSDSDVFPGNSCYNFLEQGVTTQITGNCGYSPAPYYEGALRQQKGRNPPDAFARMVQQAATMGSFFDVARSASMGTNMAFFVGHNNLRGKTMGFSADAPTGAQLQAMRQDLLEAMEAGCLGFSTGLVYAPSVYGSTRELIQLAKTMVPYGGIYATHIRNEASNVLDAVEEAIRIGEEAGVQVQISHLKVIGRHNTGLSRQVLERIDAANARGVTVYADQYPYTASSATLHSRIPPKYHVGGIAALLERLKDPAVRKQIEYSIFHETEEFESSIFAAGFDGTLLTSLPKTPELTGKTLGELARQLGKDPMDVYCDILVANDCLGQGIYFNQNEEDMLRILTHPRVFGGSDSSNFPDERFSPTRRGGRHPRGTATMLQRLALQRDHRMCTQEEAVHRITGGPARAFHLNDQGLLQEGFAANITVFDYENLRANATYQQPYLENEGIAYVLVNGTVAVQNGRATGARAGKLLTRE